MKLNNKGKAGLSFLLSVLSLVILLQGIVPEVKATAVCENPGVPNGTEDFEDYQLFSKPGSPGVGQAGNTCMYSYLSTNAGYIVSSPVYEGEQAFYNEASGSAYFNISNFCSTTGSTISGYAYLTGLPPANEYIVIGHDSHNSANYAINSAGTPGVLLRSSTGNAFQFYAMPGATGAWTINNFWHFSFSYFETSNAASTCEPGSFLAFFNHTQYGISQAVGGLPFSGCACGSTWDTFSAGRTQYMSNGADLGVTMYLDNLTFSGYVPVVTPSSTVSVTGLTGFDIDKYGDYVIARTNSGDFVRVYDGNNLGASFINEDTNCLMNHGVAALKTKDFTADPMFAYFLCGGTTPDDIKFNTADGSVHLRGNTGAHDTDIPSGDLIFDVSGFDAEQFYYDIVFPYGGLIEQCATVQIFESFSEDITKCVYGFDWTTGGANGAFYGLPTAITYHQDTDPMDSASLQWGQDYEQDTETYTTAAVDGICANGWGTTYIVEDSSSTRGYLLTYTNDLQDGGIGDAGQTPTHTGSIALSYGTPASGNLGRDIDCSFLLGTGSGNTKLLIATTTKVLLINTTSTNEIEWQIPTTTAVKVALSGDGKWASYTDATTTYIYDTMIETVEGTPKLLGTIANPAGTMIDTEIDHLGQELFIATSTSINRYNLFSITTINETAPGEGSGSSSSSSSSGSGSGSLTSGSGNCLGCSPLPTTGAGSRPFGIDVNYVADGLGLPVVGVQVLVGLILVVVFAVWMWKGTGSVVMTVLGAGLGLLVATVMTLIPAWVVMAIVLFLLIIFGKMLFGGFGGGEES